MGEVPHDCNTAMCDHPQGPAQNFRDGWGCDRETEWVQVDNEEQPILFHGKQLHRCPRAVLKEIGAEVFRPLNYFNAVYDAHGHLPSGGGFHDQPASWCSAVMLMQGEKNRIQRKQHERAAQQAKAK